MFGTDYLSRQIASWIWGRREPPPTPQPQAPPPQREPPPQPQEVERSGKRDRGVFGSALEANQPRTTQGAMDEPGGRRAADVPGSGPLAAANVNPVRIPPEVRVAEFDIKRLVQSGTRNAPELALETGRAAQRLLNANGANLDVDGRLGPKFRQALAAFRKANNLEKGSGHGTGIDQRTIDALLKGSREPHDRGRTFTGFANATETQRSAGNLLALLSNEDPQRFAQLLHAAGVQVPRSGPFEVTPAIADKVIRAIERPDVGHGLPFNEHTRTTLTYDSRELPNGEWTHEAALVAAGVGSQRRGNRYDAPVLSRELNRDIYKSELLRRVAALEGIPLHEAQALIATESDGMFIGANQYGATGYTQVTDELAREFRIINNRVTHVGSQYSGPGQHISITNKEHNLRLGLAVRRGFYYNEAVRALGLPSDGPRTDRAMSTVDAGYNAGISRLKSYVGTPNFEQTRNQIFQIRAYMAIFAHRNQRAGVATR